MDTSKGFLVKQKGFLMRKSLSQTWFLLFLSPILFLISGCNQDAPAAKLAITSPSDGYLFCFWNMENFFDDRNDGRKGPGDREYDSWFANNPGILKLKLTKLTDALLKLNDGRGPDILAMAEVESQRAGELLQNALNERLPDPSLHYTTLLFKEVSAGRHIAPAILTRLPVVKNKTRLQGKRQRILEGHIVVDGRELVVFASHWTSRMRQGSERGRADYADSIYGAVHAMIKSNPDVDVLVCGDFNDTPQDDSVVHHLHAVADAQSVLRGSEPPLLYNLMGNKNPANFGTHYFNKWLIFDQLVVSPGMLDNAGWSCDPASVQTVNTLTRPGDRLHRPWRFGGERDHGERGYSDHFPVAVRLKVQ
jgi:endonuclease/exonuclease/phosphatase family metal-dependent hydrolase